MSQLNISRTLLVYQEIDLFHRKRPRARPRHDLSVSESHSKAFYSWIPERQTFSLKHLKSFHHPPYIYSNFVFLDFSNFILFHKMHKVKIRKVKVIIKNHQNLQYFTVLTYSSLRHSENTAYCDPTHQN